MRIELLEPSRKSTHNVPNVLGNTASAEIAEGKAQLTTVMQKELFQESDCDHAVQALTKNMAFFIKRQGNVSSEKGWTHHN